MNKEASQVLLSRHNIPHDFGYSKEDLESLMDHTLSQTLFEIEKLSLLQKFFLRDLLDVKVSEDSSGGSFA